MLRSWILLVCLLQYFVICNGIYNQVISRGLDITSQIVKMGTTIVFVNNGPSPIYKYDYYVDDDVDHFSIHFFVQNDMGDRRYLNYAEQPSKRKNKFVVELGQMVRVNASFKFNTNCYIYNKINSFALINNYTHLVQYTSNLYYFSKYKTDLYYNVITVNKSDVMEHTPHTFLPNDQPDLMFSKHNVKPFTYDEVKIIYKTNIQFYRVTNLKRTVILSHWHNILIQDEVHVTNVGPPLGSFRLYHNKREKYTLTTYLPELARDIRLYDNLGNIYNVGIEYEEGGYIEGRFEEGRLKITFDPRFTLFRSYKAHYIMQYMLPTYAHIRYKGVYFQAELHLLNYILPEAIIENATMQIVLPEGAKMRDERHNSKFTVERTENYKKMLSFARVSFVYSTNYVTQTDVHVITVRYSFLQAYLWVPAVILSFYLWLFNLSVCLFKRLCWKLNCRFLSD